jgi:hypothetical protein
LFDMRMDAICRASGPPFPRTALWPALVVAAMPIAGMAIYSLGAFRLTGHPLVWAELQSVAWGRQWQGLDQSLLRELGLMSRLGLLSYSAQWPVETLHMLAAFFAIAAIWPVSRRLGAPYGLFIAVNTLLPLLAGGLVSMGRFTSVLFPIFIWLGLVVREQARPLLAAVFAMGQALAAAMFFTWRPIF